MSRLIHEGLRQYREDDGLPAILFMDGSHERRFTLDKTSGVALIRLIAEALDIDVVIRGRPFVRRRLRRACPSPSERTFP